MPWWWRSRRAQWLQAQGAQQIYFKYCSTFDSWYQGDKLGNIGNVADALMDALGASFTVATPAFPDNGRTVFKGHLFVGEVLLSESGMKDHPLTPMTDANLVRVLQAQTRRRVGLIDYRAVAAGPQAVRDRMVALQKEGVGLAVVDAVSNDDLLRLGPALKGLPLVTGGSGVAIGLPQNWGLQATPTASALPLASGRQAVVSGSCSVATNTQVAHFVESGGAALRLDVAAAVAGDAAGAGVQNLVGQALQWAQAHFAADARQPVLIYSTAEPQAVKALQSQVGSEHAGARIEQALSAIAAGLVGQLGVGQLVVAGGETSGACVQALGIEHMQIGAQIDPGVPWCYATAHVPGAGSHPLHLALKSGNFGTPDFFVKALRLLDSRGA
jgi:3-dehydrotetronate 4-kinase